MKAKYILSTLALLFVFGCASTSAVLADYDDNIDFNQYATFVLCIDDLFVENTNYPNYDNNEVRQLIGDAIEAEMELIGHKTNVLNPELQVGFQLVIQQKEATFTNCESQGDYNYWHECKIDTIVYTEETLVIYVSDFNKNQVIWQASVQCDLNRSKSKLKPYVKSLIEQLFDEYPRV